MKIGENIKLLREKRGLSRKDLAKILDVTDVTISRYENGKREPNIDTLNKISKALRANIDDLTRYDESFDFEILFEAMNLSWDYFPEGKDVRIYLAEYINVDYKILEDFEANKIPNLPLDCIKSLLKFISEKSPKQFNTIYNDLISRNMYDLDMEVKSYCQNLYSKTEHAVDISDQETVNIFLSFMRSHGYPTMELDTETLKYLYEKVIDLLDFEVYKLEKTNFILKEKS